MSRLENIGVTVNVKLKRFDDGSLSLRLSPFNKDVPTFSREQESSNFEALETALEKDMVTAAREYDYAVKGILKKYHFKEAATNVE